ncbi:hypothetical protein [Planctomycetes bacterium Poly30]|uniref:hypothetical protein n=1 Tax=Saltatorellus ferox TaxID=2528018 RepID=UPI0011A0B486
MNPLLIALCSLALSPQERSAESDHVARPAATDTARFLTSRKSPIELPLPDEEDAFFFMVYGDRTGGPASGVALLRQAVEETNLIDPDLVLTVGDLVQGYKRAG